MGYCGFRGSPINGNGFSPSGSPPVSKYDASHLTMTYSSLLALLLLGDNLERVDRKAVLTSVGALQLPSGSFSAVVNHGETDVRFVFSAIAICYLLNDFSTINADSAVAFMEKCQAYDGGFGQGPGCESHGGSTYCVVAAYSLLGKLDLIKNKDRLIEWLLMMQDQGFHGRVNKVDDTCYSFWTGATLENLEAYHLADRNAVIAYLNLTHTKFGGFSKIPRQYPDVMHSTLGLFGLSLADNSELKTLFAAVGVSADVIERAKSLWLRK